MKKKIKVILISGLIAILPIFITLFILNWVISSVEQTVGAFITNAINIKIPGVGIITTVLLVFTIGFISQMYIGKKITSVIERIFTKIPVVKTIFMPVKEIVKKLGTDGNKSFKEVVMLEFPSQGTYSIGFVTNDFIDILGSSKVPVFIPTTPNPTNGFLVYVDIDRYISLDVSIEKAIKMIVSMGTVSPDIIKSNNKVCQTDVFNGD